MKLMATRFPQFLLLLSLLWGASSTHAQQPGSIFRSADQRPRHNDQQLARIGIRVYESKRLKLYADIDLETAAKLPQFIDQAYQAWEGYFGKLPPAWDRSEFQITGYLIGDPALFREAGLIPRDLAPFLNGRHRGLEFWMNNQAEEYYLRHLLIHEATHCFMTSLPNSNLPIWYLEGMAEWFGTHRVLPNGQVEFGVMPEDREQFGGLGRITIIERSIAADNFHPLDRVLNLQANDFLKNESYAWSWALCEFFETHPRYHDAFRELGSYLSGRNFERLFREKFAPHLETLRVEWAIYAHQLQHGYDHARAAVELRPGKPARRIYWFSISASQGWQSSGLAVEQGRSYRISASGQILLDEKPKPWISEPRGISFRYFNGQPLGKLILAVHSSSDGKSYPFQLTPVGSELEFLAPVSGTLYFRINDDWSNLGNNSGNYLVKLAPQ